MNQKRSTATSPLVRLVGWQPGPGVSATDVRPPASSPRLAQGLVSAAAIATTGLLAPTALASPGDLDPSFADVGRRSDLDLDGPLWSLDVQDNDAIAFAGGEEYCSYYYSSCSLSDFTGRLLPDGMTDTGFSAAPLGNAVVYDTAQQSDGKVVGVGRAKQPNGANDLLVFRRLPNGSLDAGFGVGGQVLIGDPGNAIQAGRSVMIEPDGRIVVAGTRGNTAIVARLLANGAQDPAFGTGGVVALSGLAEREWVVRAAGGGYRVMTGWPGRNCTVSGLNEAGVLDAGFGNAGVAVATVDAPRVPGECNALAVDTTGNLLVGGRSSGPPGTPNGYVVRMLANGSRDPSFSDAPIFNQFSEVTALAVGPTGSVFVAGRDRTGFAGAMVVRMLPDGSVDPLYGRAGSSRFELNAPRSVRPVIRDMRALRDDALVVGGSRQKDNYRTSPFVARLLGNAAVGGPGVLSTQQDGVLGTEQSGQVTVTVHRIGGSRGAIAVSYAARDLVGQSITTGAKASSGQDYTAIAGRLTWADGDDSDRQVVVPIASDTLAEPPEFFELALHSPEGGAGLGVSGTTIEVAGEGYPAGLLTIRPGQETVPEGDVAYFEIHRDPYAVGVVTATVRVAGGSATPGRDFASEAARNAWRDVVVTFQDNQNFAQVPVSTLRDGKKEAPETITLELVSPTGGAALGSQTTATVTIVQADSASGGGGSGGGGGTLGWLTALLLGLGGGLRRRLAR